jgi:glycerol uptake facilitator-like aquaporin
MWIPHNASGTGAANLQKEVQGIYIIPALVGAFVGAFSCAALMKAKALSTSKVTAQKATTSRVAPEMLRKAS